MSSSSFMRTAQLLLVFAMLATGAFAQVSIVPTTGSNVLDGEPPHLLITGLRPGEMVTVHSFRKSTAYEPPNYTAVPLLACAEAVFTADSAGRISVDSAAPIHGTYSGIDPLGLLWSGNRLSLDGSPKLPVTQAVRLQSSTDILFRVEAPSLGVGKWVETVIHLTDGADLLDIQTVSMSGLNGVFARPKAKSVGPLPAIILLHGSEGGSSASARETAIRFAQLGYAAFALNYFAWPGSGVSGVPQALVDIPVEVLATTRTWLMAQPGVEAQTLAVWGASKGAELALVGAAHYAWIHRVVACVPSSVVWSGFGRPPAAGEVYSSWSIDGKGLPYIPYDNFQDALDRKFSSAFVHQRSLDKADPEQRAAARIPIEKSDARFLLLAARKDVVWPSASMTRDIEASLRAAHKESEAKAIIFPEASHYICGTGSEPRRINPVHRPEGDDPTPEADANAAATSWKETKAFLQKH
jgi:dienelactone hydrolase